MRFLLHGMIVLMLLAQTCGGASAHFQEGVKVRSIVIARDGDAVSAFVRTPLPLLFADAVAAAQARDEPLGTDIVYSVDTATGLVFHVSLDAIEDDAAGFAKRLEQALSFSQNGEPVPARLEEFRIRAMLSDTPFDSAQSARDAFGEAGADRDPLFGEAIVDMRLSLDLPAPDGTIELVSLQPPMPLPDGVSVDNHVVDARRAPPAAYTHPGQLEEPVTIDGSPWRTVAEFVRQGVLHIVEGIDHVFLVVCLALGVGTWRRLLWIVTAFTFGHSVTLIATFLGATPAWPWFIPAVETSIAATVLYAAAAAFFRRMDSIAVIAGVGLLHGLGFSFVLGEILGRQSPNLVPALAAFNVGIEIGQVAIIAATLSIMAVLTRISAGATPILRNAALAGIAAISAWWVVERGAALVA